MDWASIPPSRFGDKIHPLILQQVDHLAQFAPIDSVRDGALEHRRIGAAVVAEQAFGKELACQTGALHIDVEGLAAAVAHCRLLRLDRCSATIADGKDVRSATVDGCRRDSPRETPLSPGRRRQNETLHLCAESVFAGGAFERDHRPVRRVGLAARREKHGAYSHSGFR